MRKIVFAALCAFAAVAVSCKNDRESDVNPGDSDIDGLYINEVYSCNPDWVELYNAGNKELHIGGFILQAQCPQPVGNEVLNFPVGGCGGFQLAR